MCQESEWNVQSWTSFSPRWDQPVLHPHDEENQESACSGRKRKQSIKKRAKRAKASKTRWYHPDYLELGFVVEPGSEVCPRPLCLVCSQSLSNDAMKPSKLSRHFQAKHSDLSSKSVEYFQRLRENVLQGFRDEDSAITRKLLYASYEIALSIAQNKKPFNIGETLIKPCLVNACKILFGEVEAARVKRIPLSARTIHRRILTMSEDVERQVLRLIEKSSFFSIQLDESTDVSNRAILLCFVRFVEGQSVREDFLCALELPGRTTSSACFEALGSYFSEHGIDWKKCVGICTDGAANMVGRKTGLVARVKQVAHPELISSHCLIHREQLVAKPMSRELHEVMTTVVSIINHVRHKAMCSRLFKSLCEEMGSEYESLLLHADVRWLSRGRMLSRFFALREEIGVFLGQQKHPDADKLYDEDWIVRVAYLVDIFSQLNKLNLSLQGASQDIFTSRGKMDAFQRKIALWRSRLAEESFDMFPTCGDYVDEKHMDPGMILLCIQTHLQSLQNTFARYFPPGEDPRIGRLWIVDPFRVSLDECDLSMQEKESLIELSSDCALKLKFDAGISRAEFWLSIKEEYSMLSQNAMKILILFSTTYLCEKTFSAMTAIKTRYRSRLDVRTALRLGVSTLEPNIEELTISQSEQEQSSH
ncbi:SCAN domain-containing protein 3-like [Galendromus occidentalis]|uniref:SCAN domain-containing protein 3-like n=1 Tax=Galendromus occidentalis TaxID=34638 RepID=A0AAJ6VVF7_9ACAR|nr:SCAN domain-containing protein 3-like [Galendromus occidentalis]